MRTSEISNTEDILDSREIIKRFDELDSDHDDLIEAEADAEKELEDKRKEYDVAIKALGVGTEEEREEAKDAFDIAKEDLDEALEAYDEAKQELEDWVDREEYEGLKALIDECEGVDDWEYGATLIHEDYWETYAKDFVEETTELDKNNWLWAYIDWDGVADDMSQDYSTVDFNGQTYYVRY